MSGRQAGSNKITLGMLKGKSITTSVPSFAIRFHTEDEELEEIYADIQDNDTEKQEEETTPTEERPDIFSSNPSATCSPEATTTVPSRDPSPMKEYLKGLGKRSTSVDAGIMDISSSDTWRIFHELKGKITKTVEEKFSEMKSEKKQVSDTYRGGRLAAAGSKSKDNSSFSDREEESDGSSKDTDNCSNAHSPKKETSKEKVTDHLSENKTINQPDNAAQLTKNEEPNASSSSAPVDQAEKQVHPTNKRFAFSNKFKHLSQIRQRHKQNKVPEKIFMSQLTGNSGNVYQSVKNAEAFHKIEVEPGVEASEDLIDSNVHFSEDGMTTADYRNGVPSVHLRFSVNQLTLKEKVYYKALKYKYIILFFILFVFYKNMEFSSCYASVLTGIIIGSLGNYIYSKLYIFLNSVDNVECEVKSSAHLGDPEFKQVPIVEILAAKEYEPLTKYAGWVNEYPYTYDPETYHINDTQSVYIKLEGSVLRIFHTKQRIPKRAMWNERKHKLNFYHQRIYNIEGCTVKLLPDGLTRKRFWSKKYPICINLQKNSLIPENVAKEMTDYLSDEDIEDSTSLVSDTHDGDMDVESDLSLLTDVSGGNNLQGEMVVQESFSDDDTFCHIDKSSCESLYLYLFARTDREKEDWFRRLYSAAQITDYIRDQELSFYTTRSQFFEEDGDSLEKQYSADNISAEELTTITEYQKYLKFMSQFYPQVLTKKGVKILSSNLHGSMRDITNKDGNKEATSKDNSQTEKETRKSEEGLVDAKSDLKIEGPSMMWVNAIVGRILFDMMNNPRWINFLQERIMKKLASQKLPFFMEELLITEMDLGNTIPLLHQASYPTIDERGIWIDLSVTYRGNFCITLETKINLMKLKKFGETSNKPKPHDLSPDDKRGSPMYDSELEDTAESSEDESDINKSSDNQVTPTEGTGKKILRMVNKIAASKYFQQATEYRYIKKAMEEVSNTKLFLTIEMKSLSGILVLNVPPPPSDRIWYGFRPTPVLKLSVRPKFGERSLTFSHVLNWIEKKILQEFQKKLVLPNLDDLVLPVLSPDTTIRENYDSIQMQFPPDKP